jgi:ribosomal protein L29
MAKLKSKEIKNMGREERNKRIMELKMELIKSKAGASKAGTSKIKEVKKAISRILTVNNSQKEELKDKEKLGNLVSQETILNRRNKKH